MTENTPGVTSSEGVADAPVGESSRTGSKPIFRDQYRKEYTAEFYQENGNTGVRTETIPIGVRRNNGPQAYGPIPSFFKDIPEELTGNLKGAWAIPELIENTPQNPNRELQWLLALIDDNLTYTENPEVQAEAGRILSYLMRDQQSFSGVQDEERRQKFRNKAENMWKYGGEKANSEYVVHRDAQRNLMAQQPAGSFIEFVKYPEISRKLVENYQKTERALSDDWTKIKLVSAYIKKINSFCRGRSEIIVQYANTVKELNPTSSSVQGLELIARMTGRIPASPKTTSLIESVNLVGNRPELAEPDLSPLDQLSQQQAEEYEDVICEKYRNFADSYHKKAVGVLKNAKTAFQQLASVADSLHHAVKNTNGAEAMTIKRMADEFDDGLATLFNVRRIQIYEGQTVDYDLMEPTGAVSTTDESKHETIESVTREGYLSDPALSLDAEGAGDILQEPQVEVYSVAIK